jgi:glycosyltransferase involved in cell wall biosynthesis
MASELRPYFGSEALLSSKVAVVPPWADASCSRCGAQERDLFRQSLGISDGELLITYSGNLGLTHPLEHLLDAASILQDSNANLPISFLIIGNGPKRPHLERLASSLVLPHSRLRFLDPLPLDHLPSLLSATDLAVVALDGPSATASLPSKTFSALACGAPLLVLAPTTSSLAMLVSSHHCGFVIPPGPDASVHIVSAIVDLLANPSRLRQWSLNALAASESYTATNADTLINIMLGEPGA